MSNDKNAQWHGGKGSHRRNANNNAYSDGWDAIFNKQVESNDLEDNTAELRAQTWNPEIQLELPNVTTKLIGNEGHDSLPDIEDLTYFEESPTDRYLRHMESIRKAQSTERDEYLNETSKVPCAYTNMDDVPNEK